MITGVRVCDIGELTALLPVELPAVHNDAAQSGTVSADKFCSGMDHYICAVFDGTDQIRGAEGIVDDQGQAVLMGNFCNSIDIGNIAVGIAQGLQVNRPGVFLNGVFHFTQVMGIYKSRVDAESRQRVFQQIETAAVDGLLGHDMPAVSRQCLHSVGHRRCARGKGQRCAASFQCSQPFFQHILGGIGQPSVNVAGIFQTEPVRCVLAVVEHIGSGLVNRHRPGIRRRVCLFLSNV